MKRKLKKLKKSELIELLLEQDGEKIESEELQKELLREKYAQHYRSVLFSTVGALLCAAASAVLAATLLLPVLRIYGSSMSPTLEDGEIVVTVKSQHLEAGDIIAFYYGNKLLVKRYIAGPGDWVRIDADGRVFVNDKELNEPYISNPAQGDSDIEYPYQVPEGRVFVLGDQRSVSVDSRYSAIGCVAEEQMVGRVEFIVWPLKEFGRVG